MRNHQDCIDACLHCAQECEHCANACLTEDDVNGRGDCIRMHRDCAAMCWLTAGALSRESRFSEEICQLCGEMCEICAVECERFYDEHCQYCAEACRRCADECLRVAGVAAIPLP